jgi:membrane-bound ClpP family serine protease
VVHILLLVAAGSSARVGDDSLVECVFDHDLPLLVWRGGLSDDALWQLRAGVVFVLAAICGLAGGALIFWFLTKVLLPHERELTPDETAVTGVVGRVSSAIRAGGTGEVLYEQLGARRSVPARADLGEPIPQGEEVFVVRYEEGIAYVRRWEDLQEMTR